MMKVPLTWLKDLVEINLPVDELAYRLTMAGLEVGEIRYVGLPIQRTADMEWTSGHVHRYETKISGIEWDPGKIVVGAIHEVMPHPNADRLVLCRLDDGEGEHIVLTGAPNLFPYKGMGELGKPLKVAYARQGAQLYDGHKTGQVLMTLKPTKIRGIESSSMACSEKELGISDDHEGVIILDQQAPTGMPLADYMGDIVLDIEIAPNIARDANIIGVAREIAALIDQKLRYPSLDTPMQGPSIKGRVSIEIREPQLNPRFVLGLIEGIKIKPSPYEIQRRLRLAGMRPINNVVDATNYAMLELGEPLHAFDYDILIERAGKESPKIITRTAQPGEILTTLDGEEHQLDDFTVLVCDTAGALSIAGVMGGAESEVNENTRNVLLEGASWNFINIRRTEISQRMSSEASYRFSRGVHPAMADRGVRRGLELMRQWTGGVVARGLVDNYPLPPKDPIVEVTKIDVKRWLGIALEPQEIADLLRRLEFSVDVEKDTVRATTPDHRLDISEGIVGLADIMEELARIHGYDLIPETRISDELPPQIGNPNVEKEERLRDLLVSLGLQEVITYRLTSPENESRHRLSGSSQTQKPYVGLVNPIASNRNVMRQSLLASLLEIVEQNARIRHRQTFFEIGPVFYPSEEDQLPEEPQKLVIIMTGPRHLPTWDMADTIPLDFYDLKGALTAILEGLHLPNSRFEPIQHASFHPGKCASLWLDDHEIGVFGEIHPLVREHYDLPEYPIVAAELDLNTLLTLVPDRYNIVPVPAYPPVLEDLAFVVDEKLPAAQVLQTIQKAGGDTIVAIDLFDVYRGEQIGPGKKSLAYNLTYQDPNRTLTDEDVAIIRRRIIKKLDMELGAKLRQ
jgi:phenylalanyl-tRNA synthetase beta chain